MQCIGDSSVKDFVLKAPTKADVVVFEYAIACTHVKNYIADSFSGYFGPLIELLQSYIGKCEIRTDGQCSLVLDFTSLNRPHNMLLIAAQLEANRSFEVSYPSASSIKIYCRQLSYDGPQLVFRIPKLYYSGKGSFKLRDSQAWSLDAKAELETCPINTERRKLVCRTCDIPAEIQEQVLVIPYLTHYFIGSVKHSSEAETNSDHIGSLNTACVIFDLPPTPRRNCCFLGKH